MRYSRGCGSGDAAATQKVSVWCCVVLVGHFGAGLGVVYCC